MRQFATYDDHGAHSLYPRICLRCGRHIGGHAFRTVYGYITRDDGTKIHSCGEPVHDRCTGAQTPRETYLYFDFEHSPGDHRRAVEAGISFNAASGHYHARLGKKRLGIFDSLQEAREARRIAQSRAKEGATA